MFRQTVQRFATAFCAVRSYATETTSVTEIVRKTVKPVDSRKTYLVDTYTHIIKNSPVLLVLHHNNLLKADNNNLRAQIKKAGGDLTVTRSRIFRVALRGKDHEDPASLEAAEQYRRKPHPLSALFSGPSAVISFSDLDPKKVEKVINIVDKSKNNLILLGSVVDNKVMSVSEVQEFKKLPNLAELRGQLLGVLNILGGAGLVRTLETAGQHLYLTMEERRKQLDPTEESETKTE